MSSRFTCPVCNCDDSFNELRLLLFHVCHEHYVMQYAPGLCCKVSGCGTVTKKHMKHFTSTCEENISLKVHIVPVMTFFRIVQQILQVKVIILLKLTVLN